LGFGRKGVKVMGIFDDIFNDEDFEIKDEEELVDDSPDPAPPSDTWGEVSDPSGNWDTGKQQDLWNTDEPWTCDDCDPKADCSDCQDDEHDDGQDSDDVLDDWF
jgi:hypothetical protein